MPSLGLRFDRASFPEVKDFTVKLVRLARTLDADVLTSDISQIQMASIEDRAYHQPQLSFKFTQTAHGNRRAL